MIRVARLQIETAPSKFFNRYDKLFENGSEKYPKKDPRKDPKRVWTALVLYRPSQPPRQRKFQKIGEITKFPSLAPLPTRGTITKKLPKKYKITPRSVDFTSIF